MILDEAHERPGAPNVLRTSGVGPLAERLGSLGYSSRLTAWELTNLRLTRFHDEVQNMHRQRALWRRAEFCHLGMGNSQLLACLQSFSPLQLAD